MNQSFDELKEKYLQLKAGIDVPLSPASMLYPHSVGGVPITLPNYALIARSIIAMEVVADKEFTRLKQEHQYLQEEYAFINKMSNSPLLGKDEVQTINERKDVLDKRGEALETKVKNEVVHFAFTKLLYFAEINSEIKPNITYHYYAHENDRLVLSLIGPDQQPPFDNYVGSVRREDDDTLRVTQVAKNYTKRVLTSD